MIVPNKYCSFDQSILSKLPVILRECGEEILLLELYNRVEKKIGGIESFIYAIDVLFVLNRLDVDFQTGIVTYVN